MTSGDRASPRDAIDLQSDAAILAFCGSARRGSINRQLLEMAAERAIGLGADVSFLELRDLDLPIYDHDIEADAMPQGVLVLRQMLCAHDGLLIATPEYNGSLPPLLKNALDWGSRPVFGTAALAPFRSKLAMIMAASTGPHGGVRCLGHLRAILAKMGVVVLPGEVAMPTAHLAFRNDRLRDRVAQQGLDTQIERLVAELRLRGGEIQPR